MYSKLLVTFFVLFQNQEFLKLQAEQLASENKVNNLSQLITILSIALITVIILLSINLFNVYKLKAENKTLRQKLKS